MSCRQRIVRHAALVPSMTASASEVEALKVEKLCALVDAMLVRFTTAVDVCEYLTPEPECARLKKVTRYFNLEPFVETTWFKDAVEIPAPTNEEIIALKLYPPNVAKVTCERVDVLPFEVAGPAIAQTYADLLAAALAANPVYYPTFGTAVNTDTVLAVEGIEKSGGNILHNGIEVGGFSDLDGVNLANTVEVAAGCTAVITFCLQRCQDKAGNVV